MSEIVLCVQPHLDQILDEDRLTDRTDQCFSHLRFGGDRLDLCSLGDRGHINQLDEIAADVEVFCLKGRGNTGTS